MTTNRAYRNALDPEDALKELKNCIDRFYNKEIVLAFERVLIDEGIIK